MTIALRIATWIGWWGLASCACLAVWMLWNVLLDLRARRLARYRLRLIQEEQAEADLEALRKRVNVVPMRTYGSKTRH